MTHKLIFWPQDVEIRLNENQFIDLGQDLPPPVIREEGANGLNPQVRGENESIVQPRVGGEGRSRREYQAKQGDCCCRKTLVDKQRDGVTAPVMTKGKGMTQRKDVPSPLRHPRPPTPRDLETTVASMQNVLSTILEGKTQTSHFLYKGRGQECEISTAHGNRENSMSSTNGTLKDESGKGLSQNESLRGRSKQHESTRHGKTATGEHRACTPCSRAKQEEGVTPQPWWRAVR
uniref:Uncharacterized protein n=1 Tax=Cannabis sativa TaxID=3483 RepID=A0A803QBV5_CANSA